MTESFGIIPITVAAFAGTNLDNVLLLIALLSASGIRRRQVIGGYLFAMFLLLGISFAVGKAAELIPAGYLGYLGVVPFSLGIISLIRLMPGEKSGPADPEPKLSSASSVFAATTFQPDAAERQAVRHRHDEAAARAMGRQCGHHERQPEPESVHQSASGRRRALCARKPAPMPIRIATITPSLSGMA